MTDYGREERREANRWIRWFLFWGALILVAIASIAVVGWGLRVAASPIKGQGDAIQKKYSAENWTAAQARFEDLYSDIEQSDRKVHVAKLAQAADPTNETRKDEYVGTQTYCLSVVAQYNAEARHYLSADFKAADLPSRIDDSNPETDCR